MDAHGGGPAGTGGPTGPGRPGGQTDPLLPQNIKKVKLRSIVSGLKVEPVGKLADGVGKSYTLQGVDQAGNMVEWVIKPTGPNSFELTVPKGHELGTPDAWENVSIMTQRVVTRGTASSCGCDGNQCGCQGQNCGSNCNSAASRLRLVGDIRTA